MPALTIWVILLEYLSQYLFGNISKMLKLKLPRFFKRLWQRNYYERIIRNEKRIFGDKKLY
jgi:phage antirepressor YoqD-like protein